ncbi:MAG TPA: hypothetical protein VEV63_18295 [Streptosporangiaceae bacterium]|nr:hypothetical protein [Streptosporangiaceae bacterium]
MSLSHKRIYLAGPALFAVIAASAMALSQAAPAGASPMSASAKPRVSFSFKKVRISTSQRPAIQYTSANLPSGSKLALQRQFGTARVWKNVVLLKGSSGSARAPKVQMGRYKYRIRAYRNARTVVLSSTRLLYSFGRVPLTNICNDANTNSNVTMNAANGCQTQTVQVNGMVFTYLIRDAPQAPPNYNQDITFGVNTTCRSATFQFSMDNNAQPSDTANIELVQSRSDPQTKSVGSGQIAYAFFHFDGGPWDLDLSDTNFDWEYVNGHLSCWSASGLR